MGKLIFAIVSALLILSAGCDDASYPFQEATSGAEILYDIPGQGDVTILICNCYMNVIRDLFTSEQHEQGSYSVTWDLNDNSGSRVDDGLYTAEVFFNGNRILTILYEVYEQ